ncbi:hypothetical protein CEXT_797691 [Caerostris extrusa]|uniref:Uncharacterized protein n=1 Tax=Caerostris extrusa TaxID=172846 RepID=A0AAV4MCL5_CAEEX|nr:hypothetical protein CEXT_797691 [Caerostris extrusa]
MRKCVFMPMHFDNFSIFNGQVANFVIILATVIDCIQLGNKKGISCYAITKHTGNVELCSGVEKSLFLYWLVRDLNALGQWSPNCSTHIPEGYEDDIWDTRATEGTRKMKDTSQHSRKTALCACACINNEGDVFLSRIVTGDGAKEMEDRKWG